MLTCHCRFLFSIVATPFLAGDIHFIVHRHRIRTMRSMEHAKDYCRLHKLPLYNVQAKDDPVRTEDAPKLTDKVRADSLQLVHPHDTKGISSFLPLYQGMRLFISCKDCVRFVIVKGCPCRLEAEILAEDENFPYEHVAGHPHSLRYMPASLLLSAQDVAWTLSKDDLPKSLRRWTHVVFFRYDLPTSMSEYRLKMNI